MDQILQDLKQQGYGQQSLLKQEEIHAVFDKIISTGTIERLFPREVLNQIWQVLDKNQNNQVILGDFVHRMQNKNKLHYLPDRKDSNKKSYPINTEQQLPLNKIQNDQLNIRGQIPWSNVDSDDNMQYNINASIIESFAGDQSIISQQRDFQPNTKINEKQPKKKEKNNKKHIPKDKDLERPLLHHESILTQEEFEDRLIQDIQRPKIKEKSRYSSKSTKRSKDQVSSQLEVEEKNEKKKFNCIPKKWLIPISFFIFGVVLFAGSFALQAQIKKLAIYQVILKPQNEGLWAHFPGDSGVEIDRNWTFFNITNADNILFYNQKPRFREIKDFKIIELEDYLNITYINDGDRVQMIDWLHFIEQPETRNLDQKVKILNVGGLAYWYNIKIARPTVILQQGLSLLFTTLQESILANIYAQAINMQFLSQFNSDIYSAIFAPASITLKEAIFIWEDPAYGIGSQDNLKYWLDAIPTAEEEDNETVSEGFLFLKNYFTLKTQQLNFIISQIKSYVEFTKSAVLDNNFCQNVDSCTGRYLAYKQFSVSYVTRNPPPGKDLQANDTICMSNSTCAGYFPQLEAYYRNVYLKRFPEKNSTLVFDPEWMKNVVNYNISIQEGYNYNTAEYCIFHIGNLDALWENGTLHDAQVKEFQLNGKYSRAVQSKYLKNIQNRFHLPTLQHAHLFWKWAQYLNNEVILRNQTNDKLGVAKLFTTGIYQGFTYLQDNLQKRLLIQLIQQDLKQKGDSFNCSNFIIQSFETKDPQKAQKLCEKYGEKDQKTLLFDLLSICMNQYRQQWWKFKKVFQFSSLQLQTLCDSQQENKQSFGYLLNMRKKYLNNLYECNITPNQYCSDYELAAIQWATSKVTLNPPQELASRYKQKTYTFKQWDKNASRFQYSFYKSKYPNDTTFPNITIKEAYKFLNFDNWFSASVMLKYFADQKFNLKFKDYMRFVGIEVGLNGLTMERSARQLIFGYEDEILKQIKQSYPPFGGDPSTPSLIAFNDPNITKQQAKMTLQWSTGKYDSSLAGQYRKINGLQYLTIQKEVFNGNITMDTLQSPWQGQDYVYGTSAKMFAPDQFDQPNISLYVPNIQRYGSGVIDSDSSSQRYGFDVQIGTLGESIYYSTSESDINKKYYQNFHAIFNQTSVVGFPLFVCKNHFMNVSSNWSTLVEIYNENQTIRYETTSAYDDSFVVVEPYSGVSFQSTVYLQSNYYHTHDSLLNFYTESLLPIFSLARSGNITQDKANQLLGPLKIGLAAVKWVRIIGIVIASASFITCGVIYFLKWRSQRKKSKSQEKESDQKENKNKDPENRQKKRKQLCISMQPISRDLDQQLSSSKQEYFAHPVFEQEI